MSNQDSNGYELPWILHTENTYDNDCFRNGTRSKIIPNPLWMHPDLNSPTFALTSCFNQAILHMNQKAGEAMRLHIQDAWKWRE